MKARLTLLLFLWLAALTLLPAPPARAQGEVPTVLVITADSPVTAAMLAYLKRGIQVAEQQGAELLVFELNTPGGSIALMQDMVEAMRASQVPVVVYVSPRGAMAGSAGTLITLAGHASAMAPETTIGAASPVGAEGEDLGETMAAKEKNILKATVRSLAEGRGETAIDLAERTIESAAAASASEALEAGLVDFIAASREELLQKLDGFTVQLASGEKVLETTDAAVRELNPSLIEQLLTILTNPNIVFLLLTIGVQAILIELSSPGGWVAGFIGVVCLSLAAYGLGILPVNWFGLVFLVVAFVLFVLDIKAPTHGALTAAGVACLIVGALVLFNSPGVPSFQRVSVPLVLIASLLSGALFFSFVIFAVRAQKTPIKMGAESLPGRVGVVREPLAPLGSVQLGGELWTAETTDRNEALPSGTRVVVERVAGNKLFVHKE